MIYLFITIHIIWIILGILFHRYQNGTSRIGGAIASSKTYWLFLAVLVYYLMLPWLVYILAGTVYSIHLCIAIGVLLIRFLVQALMMYVFKNWTPNFGIAFNIILAAVCVVSIINIHKTLDAVPVYVYLFLFLLLCIATLDSYYAISFKEIVGLKTKGEKAIWFAHGENDKFTQILNVTYRANIMVSIIYLLFIISILRAYGLH